MLSQQKAHTNPRRAGARHPLLYYRRSMERIAITTLLLGIAVSVVGWFSMLKPTTILGIHSDAWLFILALGAFGLSAFAFLARFLAYVQAREGWLSLVTPFLHLRISYARIRTIRPTLIQQLFPPERLSWAGSRFISQFYGKTVLVVDLNGYPLSPAVLKLFIPDVMFSPTGEGFVLLVPDWMALSTEIDTLYGSWLQKARKK